VNRGHAVISKGDEQGARKHWEAASHIQA